MPSTWSLDPSSSLSGPGDGVVLPCSGEVVLLGRGLAGPSREGGGHRLPSAGFPAAPPARISAKFRLSEILGGRGLCNGEEGLQKFLNDPPPASGGEPAPPPTPTASPAPAIGAGEGAFEKELLGLTGGFPGGEKGLKKFIQENPRLPRPPPPRPPELPLLMPGMIVIVKNPSNPYYMYCGTVQRVTDGMAGVLFEGGNWDKLLSFRLDELERREKGPPWSTPSPPSSNPSWRRNPEASSCTYLRTYHPLS
ncbi:unnamed protein product [Spirodela intermedia]|uniref:Uncharacterized protein n=1 Tax=Spirodela intermedia TaxID=51605 RepID=A0A7I8JFB4_SPIIN|nr:unnamed protein product [Spirodela intermedia]CAA6668846.1 unnamed protein product [Spirodela intermedia]